ncbi:MAG: hypothetical protein VYE40_07945 [Myxococcota bacterium]|nr:hypothetical protein [Myxococcota bacterium]
MFKDGAKYMMFGAHPGRRITLDIEYARMGAVDVKTEATWLRYERDHPVTMRALIEGSENGTLYGCGPLHRYHKGQGKPVEVLEAAYRKYIEVNPPVKKGARAFAESYLERVLGWYKNDANHPSYDDFDDETKGKVGREDYEELVREQLAHGEKMMFTHALPIFNPKFFVHREGGPLDVDVAFWVGGGHVIRGLCFLDTAGVVDERDLKRLRYLSDYHIKAEPVFPSDIDDFHSIMVALGVEYPLNDRDPLPDHWSKPADPPF